MRRGLAPWLLLLAVTSGVGVVTYMRCPGCIERDRVNKTCEWTGDTKFPIDPQNPTHQQHLISDAQLAEDLAIRYADAEFNRRFGYEAHGGAIDNGRFRRECMARLVTSIENNHAVTLEQVGIARGQRNRLFDLVVALSFLPLYCFGTTMICLVFRRRFSSDQRHVGLVVTGLSAVAVSFLGLQLLQLWLMVWEAVRVGNGHMSGFRAATYNRWSQHYFGPQFIGGILLFWVIALLCYRVLSDDEHSADVLGPQGILLR